MKLDMRGDMGIVGICNLIYLMNQCSYRDGTSGVGKRHFWKQCYIQFDPWRCVLAEKWAPPLCIVFVCNLICFACGHTVTASRKHVVYPVSEYLGQKKPVNWLLFILIVCFSSPIQSLGSADRKENPHKKWVDLFTFSSVNPSVHLCFLLICLCLITEGLIRINVIENHCCSGGKKTIHLLFASYLYCLSLCFALTTHCKCPRQILKVSMKIELACQTH